jgi:hypothetical protein
MVSKCFEILNGVSKAPCGTGLMNEFVRALMASSEVVGGRGEAGGWCGAYAGLHIEG